jgi:hypothetical protein
MQSRRHFLASICAAGAASVVGARSSRADEPPPGTTTIRLLGDASIGQAPGFIAEDLLRAEGFIDIRYLYPSESMSVKKEELRARKIGHVILNTTTDQPWSQYFCCLMCGNSEFVDNRPIATKRVLRAIPRANEICATEPEKAARRLVDGGFAKRYDYALQKLTELHYASWRKFDAEDTMRFFALHLHEVGMITSTANKLIAEGTDWRFLNGIKRELKA